MPCCTARLRVGPGHASGHVCGRKLEPAAGRRTTSGASNAPVGGRGHAQHVQKSARGIGTRWVVARHPTAACSWPAGCSDADARARGKSRHVSISALAVARLAHVASSSRSAFAAQTRAYRPIRQLSICRRPCLSPPPASFSSANALVPCAALPPAATQGTVPATTPAPAPEATHTLSDSLTRQSAQLAQSPQPRIGR